MLETELFFLFFVFPSRLTVIPVPLLFYVINYVINYTALITALIKLCY